MSIFRAISDEKTPVRNRISDRSIQAIGLAALFCLSACGESSATFQAIKLGEENYKFGYETEDPVTEVFTYEGESAEYKVLNERTEFAQVIVAFTCNDFALYTEVYPPALGSLDQGFISGLSFSDALAGTICEDGITSEDEANLKQLIAWVD